MENLTTEQYAVLISDSITNGQHAQALRQFKEALADSVDAYPLCVGISGEGVESDKIVKLLCKVIEEA